MFQKIEMAARIPLWLTILTISRDVFIVCVALLLYLSLGQGMPIGLKTDAKGRWSLGPIAVPNDVNLIGLPLVMQAGLGPTTTPPLGTDLSNAVLLSPGR